MNATLEAAAAPLSGVRILDVADESGVYAGRVLADLGADVIRVEPPDGGRVRGRAPFLDDRPGVERSYHHLFHNAGKRSVVMDLTVPPGWDVLDRLAATADALIETPRLWDGHESCAERLHRASPGLIVASISPFGLDGPWRGRKASDLVCAAAGGLLAISGEPRFAPVQGAGDVSYKLASLAAATGILVGLFAREAGRAARAHLDISIQQCVALSTMQSANANLLAWRGLVPSRRTSWELPVLRCADGTWLCARPRPDRWAALHAWAVESGIDPRYGPDEWTEAFATPPGAVFRTGYSADVVEALTVLHTRDAFLQRAWSDDSVVCMPVQTLPEMARCAQLRSTGTFTRVEHEPLGVELGFPRSPVAGMAGAGSIRRAPLLGEHTSEVLEELGLIDTSLTDRGARSAEQGETC